MKKDDYKKFHDHIPQEVRDHAKAAHKEMHESIKSLFPPEFIEHRKNARKEMLLAAQAFISNAIDHLENPDVKKA